jgi:hypothetical protein
MKRYPDSYRSTSSIFWYKYPSQHPALKQHNTCSFLKSERPILMTIREISIIIIEVWKFLMMAWHIALIFWSKFVTTLIGGKGNKLSFCLLSREDISKTNFRNVVVLITPILEVRKQWGAPPGGRGTRVVCIRDVFILNKIWAQDKIQYLVDTLLGWNMKLALFCNLNFAKVYINL